MIDVRVALVIAMLASPASAREWLCVPDMATGFKWGGSDWQSVNFAVSHKYVVAEVDPYDLGNWTVGIEVTAIGSDIPEHRCPALLSEQIACGGLGTGFLFNVQTLRYQEVYGFGYVDGLDAPGNTPFIEIGKCSPLR